MTITKKQHTNKIMQKNVMILKYIFFMQNIYFYFVVKYDLKYVVIHPSMWLS